MQSCGGDGNRDLFCCLWTGVSCRNHAYRAHPDFSQAWPFAAREF